MIPIEKLLEVLKKVQEVRYSQEIDQFEQIEELIRDMIDN